MMRVDTLALKGGFEVFVVGDAHAFVRHMH